MRLPKISEMDSSPFLGVAGLVLPWLTAQELGVISSICKTLNQISRSITLSRSSDASKSLESVPIPFVNTVDSRPYSYFLYSPSQKHISELTAWGRQYWGAPNRKRPPSSLHNDGTDFWIGDSNSSSGGCECGPLCGRDVDENECPCSSVLQSSEDVIFECGPRCRCDSDCPKRSTQSGVRVKLKIVRDENKGWGLFADQVIPCGGFVCEYVGELLTTQEARIRQKRYDQISSAAAAAALLVVREHLPSGKACFRINIDATRVGNVARFVNHCCDGGNLSSVLVRTSGSLLPRVCFFASRDIAEGEELSFSYGGVRLKSSLDGLKCYCGSPNCYGVLPSENT